MALELLQIDLSFQYKDLRIFIPIVGGLIGFILFWFTQESKKVQQRFFDKHGPDQGSARFIMFTKYLGGFTMGVLPAIAYCIAFPDTSLFDLGLGFPKESLWMTVLWSFGLMALVIPIARSSAKNPKNLIEYPQIRAKIWDRKMVRGNLASWAAYLLGYEFLFRGVMFFPLVETIGLWPAIAVNIGMYSGTHVPKGLDQTIGAIALSVVLCLLCVQTGTIWIAFFVHIAMAWTNSLTALKHHPEMKLKS